MSLVRHNGPTVYTVRPKGRIPKDRTAKLERSTAIRVWHAAVKTKQLKTEFYTRAEAERNLPDLQALATPCGLTLTINEGFLA